MHPSISNTPSASLSARLYQFMRDHQLTSFFLLAYAFSWLVTLPYVLSVWGVIKGDFIIGYMVNKWVGPALAAMLMTRIVAGKAGSLHLRMQIRNWRVQWQWYLFIFVGIPALVLLGVLFVPSALDNFHGLTPDIPVSYLINFILIFFAVGLPEEIGWRAFALPRLQSRYGQLWGTLLLGVLWAFWHALYYLTPAHGGGPGNRFADVLLNFALFFLFVESLSIIFTWVFNHTQGSIFIAGLMHTAIDAPQLVWLPLFLPVGALNSAKGETSLLSAVIIPFGFLALLLLLLTHGALGYQPGTIKGATFEE